MQVDSDFILVPADQFPDLPPVFSSSLISPITCAIDSLAHIVNSQQMQHYSGQRFHLNAGAADGVFGW